VSSPKPRTCGAYSEDTQIRAEDNGGSARSYLTLSTLATACSRGATTLITG